MLQSGLNGGDGPADDRRVVAEALEPQHVGLAAEPGELALGVVAVSLLRRGYGLGEGHLAAQDAAGLLVSEGVKGTRSSITGRFAVLRDEAPGFVDQIFIEDGFRAFVKHG